MDASMAKKRGQTLFPGAADRAAFTLVEMLAVIVILGILVSLITAAVAAARVSAKRAKIIMEIKQLEAALNSYRERFGEFPPDCSDKNEIVRHINKAFPRNTILTGSSPWSSLQKAVQQGCGLEVGQLTPAVALPFWLGGPPQQMRSGQSSSGVKLTGFSADPTNPFNLNNTTARIQPFFEFDETRLMDDQGMPPSNRASWLCYVPDTGSTTGRMPFVYFRARGQGIGPSSKQAMPGYDDLGTYGARQQATIGYGGQTSEIVLPYRICKRDSKQPTLLRWPNDKSFQIICAGLDGKFGQGNYLPLEDFDATEPTYDNLTNFFTGQLEDAGKQQ